jgi:hypothetical protein
LYAFSRQFDDATVPLATMIPPINVIGDVALVDIAKALKAMTIHTAERLKENAILRSAIAKQAGVLLEDISDIQTKQAA